MRKTDARYPKRLNVVALAAAAGNGGNQARVKSDKIAAMRRAIASLVMTLLVAMTSWASACDLSCSLGKSHSVCKLDGAATASTAPAMSRALAGRAQQEMAMDATMVMPDEMAVTQAGAPHLHSSCMHSPCNEISISAISQAATQHPVRALQAITFVQPVVVSSFARVSSIAATQEPPDIPPFNPLSVSLRI